MSKTISIIVPVFNEKKNIPLIAKEIADVFKNIEYGYEIIFVNDGSEDNSEYLIKRMAIEVPEIKCVNLSRNFGKEIATSAGLHHASGIAAIIIDADLEHPPSLITDLISKWVEGSPVVIGLRQGGGDKSFSKKLGAKVYYKMMNAISDTHIREGATDFRIIDRKVLDEFNNLTERNRITRGLIDWLGFEREYIPFEAPRRENGKPKYSFFKLIKLGLSSAVSHSLFPLKLAGYLGLFIILISGIGGVIVLVNGYLLGDIFSWNITPVGQLAILLIFLAGTILSCLGLIALYIGNIHSEVSGRPLYVIKDLENLNKD